MESVEPIDIVMMEVKKQPVEVKASAEGLVTSPVVEELVQGSVEALITAPSCPSIESVEATSIQISAKDLHLHLEQDPADTEEASEHEETPPSSPPPPSTFENIPCLACGSNCFIKSESEPAPADPDLDDDGPAYSRFDLLLKFFQYLKIKSIRYWNSQDAASQIIPICNDCKNQLTLLLELERRLKELERDLENGVKEFKTMCVEAEEAFVLSGIYDKDRRYCKVRKQVLRGTGVFGRPKKKIGEIVPKVEGDPPRRRSQRGPKSIRTKSISALSTYSPVVAVSATDKAKADEFRDVKAEVISDGELDIDNEDGFQLNSPMNVLGGSENGDDDDDVPPEDSNIFRLNDSVEPISVVENKRKRQIKPEDSLQPKSKRRRINKKKKKPGQYPIPGKGRGRPLPKKKSRNSQVERQIVTITDDRILDAFIYGDLEEEEEIRQKKLSKRRTKKVADEEDFHLEEQDSAEDDEELWDETERTRLDPVTGSFTVLHVTYEPLLDGSEKFKCSECLGPVARSSLRKHTFKYHTARFKCKQCGQCEGSPFQLQKHIRYKHQQKRPMNECPICGKPCSSVKDRFLNHITTHYSEQEKAEAVARGEKLRMWKDRRNIQCDHCGKKFTSKKELERHSLSKHPKPEEAGMMLMYKELCPDCGKLVDRHYINLHRLRSHNVCMDANLTVGTALEQDAQANKRFICTVCDKRFFKSKELVRHKMSVHDRNYPFKCELCPRAFLLQRQLDRHMNTHSNIRPFPCGHCPMAFFTNGNRTRHINIYHKEGANPRRKAYVRGTTNFNAKRFQVNNLDDPNVAAGRPPSSNAESLESSCPQIKDDDEAASTTSRSLPDHSKAQSQPTPSGNESELLESIIQLQSSMSAAGGGGAPPASSSSATFIQDFFRNQQH